MITSVIVVGADLQAQELARRMTVQVTGPTTLSEPQPRSAAAADVLILAAGWVLPVDVCAAFSGVVISLDDGTTLSRLRETFPAATLLRASICGATPGGRPPVVVLASDSSEPLASFDEVRGILRRVASTYEVDEAGIPALIEMQRSVRGALSASISSGGSVEKP